MKLTAEYLCERHSYWVSRIGETGIWNADGFKEVKLVVRPRSKSYNGLFIRRHLKEKGKRKLVDRIFIYNNVEDFDPRFLDSLLVHEMIHQYIIQNKIKDTSTHGRLFRNMMEKINLAFPLELKINISDHNPDLERTRLEKEERRNHVILVINKKDGNSFCCVMNPAKVSFFEKMIRKNNKGWGIKDYYWAVSDHPFFNPYSRCTKVLHGIKKPTSQMEEFCREKSITKI